MWKAPICAQKDATTARRRAKDIATRSSAAHTTCTTVSQPSATHAPKVVWFARWLGAVTRVSATLDMTTRNKRVKAVPGTAATARLSGLVCVIIMRVKPATSTTLPHRLVIVRQEEAKDRSTRWRHCCTISSSILVHLSLTVRKLIQQNA